MFTDTFNAKYRYYFDKMTHAKQDFNVFINIINNKKQLLVKNYTKITHMQEITRLELCLQNKEDQTLYIACSLIFHFKTLTNQYYKNIYFWYSKCFKWGGKVKMLSSNHVKVPSSGMGGQRLR